MPNETGLNGSLCSLMSSYFLSKLNEEINMFKNILQLI